MTIVIAYRVVLGPEHVAPWIVERRLPDGEGSDADWVPIRNGARLLRHRTEREANDTAESQRCADRAAATRLGMEVEHT